MADGGQSPVALETDDIRYVVISASDKHVPDIERRFVWRPHIGGPTDSKKEGGKSHVAWRPDYG